jgi:hypothetical protein
MGRAVGSSRRVAVASVLVIASLLLPAAATARSAAGWGSPQILVPVGTATYSPAVATAPNGTTVVIWDEANSLTGQFRLLAGTRLLSGKLKINKLGSMSGAFPQGSITVGGDGTFAVAWGAPAKGASNRIAVRIWASGKHGFGPTMYLSPGNASAEQTQGDVPRVAVDDDGTAYVVWEGLYGKGTNQHYQVVERQLPSHSKRWSAPRVWRPQHCEAGQKPKCQPSDAHGAQIAANGHGNVAISWTQSSGEVMASILPAGAKAFGPAQQISAATYGVTPPTVAISADGKAVIVWEQSVSTGRRIESCVASGKKFSKRCQFLSGKGTAQFQALALASDGTGVTAWEKTAGGGAQVLARVMTAHGKAWTNSTAKLTRPGVALFVTSGPSVAATQGHAFVAWSQRLKNKLSIGVKVRVGRSWLATRTFPALSAPVVSATADAGKGSPVLGTVVWTSTKGLQIATFR